MSCVQSITNLKAICTPKQKFCIPVKFLKRQRPKLASSCKIGISCDLVQFCGEILMIYVVGTCLLLMLTVVYVIRTINFLA